MPSTWLDKQTDEFKLWYEIKQTGANSRRTGNGFTALGDMFAALNLKYGDSKSKQGFADLMLIKLKHPQKQKKPARVWILKVAYSFKSVQ